MNKGELLRLSKTVKFADVKSGNRILDLGARDGRLKNLLPIDCYYCGVDLDPKIEGIIGWNLENGLPQEISKQRFDAIFMNELIEHIQNFKTLLIQCRNLLNENGKIIISTPSANRFLISEDPTHIHCFRKSNLKNLATICQLQVTEITGTYIKIPWPKRVYLPTNQSLYTEVVIYKLIRSINKSNSTI